MKTFSRSLLLASIVLAMAALSAPSSMAADTASPAASPAAQKITKFPFNGKVKSVDTAAMTFTLGGLTSRVFAVTPTTKIRKNGQSATLKDAAVGDEVGGYGMKGADGKITALSVRFGPKPTAAASPAGSASPYTETKPKHAKTKKASPSPSPSAAAK